MMSFIELEQNDMRFLCYSFVGTLGQLFRDRPETKVQSVLEYRVLTFVIRLDD